MGFFRKLMWWKKKEKDPEEYEEEWDDSVVERKRIDINKEEDRERYLRTCCEQIADASREMENLTYEYGLEIGRAHV